MKKINIAIVAIAILGIGTIFALAQKSEFGKIDKFRHGGIHNMDRRGIGMALRGLDLTDEQKAGVKQLMETNRASLQPIMAALKENQQKMRLATANGVFDENQVTALANEQAGLMAKMIVEKERVKSQVFSMLTDEQKAKSAEMREKMKERFKNRGMNRKGGETPSEGSQL